MHQAIILHICFINYLTISAVFPEYMGIEYIKYLISNVTIFIYLTVIESVLW